MRRWILWLLVAALVLAGCSTVQRAKVHQMTYLDLFDTVTYISRYTDDPEGFQKEADEIHESLMEYHRLFDIYHDYDGLNNLKTINDHAGIAPVKVDPRILSMLADCRGYYEATDGAVNVAMGSVLKLWHDARSDAVSNPSGAKLPDRAALEAAKEHCSWDTVILDEAAGTVYLSDPQQRLDVGAIAKGWALQRVAEELPAGILINLGGNVCATGPKKGENTPWIIGVHDPKDQSSYLCTLNLMTGSAVTSGDYQRFFTVNGQNYHHIIDPQTGMPSAYWRSVTILSDDSGLADALSTALFVMDRDRGQTLLNRYGAEAMWVDDQGNCFYSDGLTAYLQQEK